VPYKIEHADALEWLAAQPSACAQFVIYDPPYAVGSPVRGREDGAAGSLFGPLSFLSRTLREVARVLRPGGVCEVFADWRRLSDLGYVASTVGLRPAGCVAWIRNRPGTGGLVRSSWDPILLVARGLPRAVDRAAVRNVCETDEIEGDLGETVGPRLWAPDEPLDDVVRADYPTKRRHPYGKPEAVFAHVMRRCVKAGDIVLDPFAGSGASARAALALGAEWRGCDIDPDFVGDFG